MAEQSESLLDPQSPILIVDDNPQYSRVLRSMLEKSLGFANIVTVDSPDAGMKLVEASPGKFRLLFIDYHFPDGSNGGTLLEQLRERGVLSGATAFLITSEPTLANFKHALSAGARGVVAKPFDTAEIKRQIEKAERARVTHAEED